MNIGFWNINSTENNKKDLSDALTSLTLEKQLDIICIAEITDETVLSFLEKVNTQIIDKRYTYSRVPSAKRKLIVVSRYANTFFEDKSLLYTSNRWVAHKIVIPTIVTLNLISVHFPSKVNWSETCLALECVNLSTDIATIEKNTNCTNTILIGDFNMNPFESGLVASNGINALSDLKYASDNANTGRIIHGTKYNFFYNPMWNFFGDFTEPYGTHYFRPPGHVSHEWHIYDQVIFRPSLKQYLNWFAEENLDVISGESIAKKSDRPGFVEVVNKISGENLTKVFGRPDDVKYSDHLPIILKLKL